MVRNFLMMTVVLASLQLVAADSVKITDSAKTKVVKTPSPLMPFIEQPTYKSAWKIIIPAPGVTPAQFNAGSTIRVNASEGGGSSDFNVDYTFSDDPAYTAGKKSVKIVEKSIGGVKGFATLGVLTAKIGKDQIVVTITANVLSLYAQQFLNYGSLGVVQYPEGKGEASNTFDLVANVGDAKKTFSGITYTVKYTNKKKGDTYWQGSAKGVARQ